MQPINIPKLLKFGQNRRILQPTNVPKWLKTQPMSVGGTRRHIPYICTEFPLGWKLDTAKGRGGMEGRRMRGGGGGGGRVQSERRS